MTDHDMILRIQELLDGVEWTPSIVAEIADMLTENGYSVESRKARPMFLTNKRHLPKHRP